MAFTAVNGPLRDVEMLGMYSLRAALPTFHYSYSPELLYC